MDTIRVNEIQGIIDDLNNIIEKLNRFAHEPVKKEVEPKKEEPVIHKKSEVEPKKEPIKKPDGSYTVRTSQTGDKVYMIKDGKRTWVKNPETLTKLGFVLGQEKRIEYKELLTFEEDKPIDLRGHKSEKMAEQKVDTNKKNNPVLGYKEVATIDDYLNEQTKYDEPAS